MPQNGQTHFKCCKIFKVCLTSLGHYALRGSILENPMPDNLDQVKKLNSFLHDILKA